MRIIWLLYEGAKEFYEDVVEICQDIYWYFKDAEAKKSRAVLERMKEEDSEQELLSKLEIAKLNTEAKRVNIETEIVKS